ncbi:MAG: signal recognition particle subunit SRP19/SEC65 family protein [Candidatus Hodarchaeota archaeon]
MRKRKQKDGFYVFFPEYFNKNLARTEGRRLPLNFCIENPSLAELRLAAEKLGFVYELSPNAAYPRQWWARNGLIRIEKGEKNKTELLQIMGKTVTQIIRPALEKKRKELEIAQQKKKGKKGISRGYKKTEGEKAKRDAKQLQKSKKRIKRR